MQFLQTRYPLEFHTEQFLLNKLKSYEACEKRRKTLPKALAAQPHVMVRVHRASEELGGGIDAAEFEKRYLFINPKVEPQMALLTLDGVTCTQPKLQGELFDGHATALARALSSVRETHLKNRPHET